MLDNLEGSSYVNAEPIIDYRETETRMAACILSQLISSRVPIEALTTPEIRLNRKQSTVHPGQLSRTDFTSLNAIYEADVDSTTVMMCSLDREFRPIVEDIAPYVREIAALDFEIENEKVRMGLGAAAKKMRLSRVSRTALEGGRREEKRKDRWFSRELNLRAVLETGRREWMAGARSLQDSERQSSRAPI